MHSRTESSVSLGEADKYPLWQSTLIALVSSVIINLIILRLTKPLAPDFPSLSILTVSAWTIIGVFGAAFVFALIRRRSKNPERTFVRVSLVVLILSFIPDILLFFVEVPGFTGVTAGGLWALMAMHVTTAAVVVPVFVRATQSFRVTRTYEYRHY